jgi:hypothetical protein
MNVGKPLWRQVYWAGLTKSDYNWESHV